MNADMFPQNPPWVFITSANKLTLKYSDIHGVGVFARENITKGEILDSSRPLRINICLCIISIFIHKILRLLGLDNSTNIFNFIFLGKSRINSTDKKTAHIVPSLLSYCNSSDKPNIKIYFDYSSQIYYFFSLRNISLGEEILIEYK
jgi:SET domain-containing protein